MSASGILSRHMAQVRAMGRVPPEAHFGLLETWAQRKARLARERADRAAANPRPEPRR